MESSLMEELLRYSTCTLSTSLNADWPSRPSQHCQNDDWPTRISGHTQLVHAWYLTTTMQVQGDWLVLYNHSGCRHIYILYNVLYPPAYPHFVIVQECELNKVRILFIHKYYPQYYHKRGGINQNVPIPVELS